MPGRVLGLDHGTARVGVAISDPLQITAAPLTVLDRASAIDGIVELVAEYRPVTVVVGLPVTRKGAEGVSAEEARSFGDEVGRATGLPIEYVDERFTTHTAEQVMRQGGVGSRERRGKVDKVAAAVILRQYLDRTTRSM